MKPQSEIDYPFHPLPPPPYRPVLGIMLIGINWGLFLVVLVGSYWLMPRNPSLLLVFIVVACLFVSRPFLINLMARGRALRQVDAIALLAAHPEPPVLFLRSFSDDPLVDTTPASGRSSVWTGLAPSVPTYETRLQKALRPLGPVICIGRPGEALPELGAARLYVSNEEWQTAVRYFLPRAAAVALMMGSTDGLLWEIQTVLQVARWEHLLFFFPYVYPVERSRGWRYRFVLGSNSYRFTVGRYKIQQQMVQERDTRYSLFCERVQPFVTEPLPESLGTACFLTFSPEGKPQLLTTRYPSPGGFFKPVLSSEVDIEWTLAPFIERLSGRRLPPPRRVWLIQHRLVFILILLLGIIFFCSGGFLFLQHGWYGLILFYAGVFLINLALESLAAAIRDKNRVGPGQG